MPFDDEIFAAALELPPAERSAFLLQTCSGDVDMRERVAALLKGHGQAGNFLKEPLIPREEIAGRELPAEMIGRYKLLGKIGEGGCGVVYEAEQQEPVRRRVALKVIKLGMDTNAVIARFQAERQALALMDHPNIARVYDAGATEAGRPYFVMELVRGIPITAYCDRNHFTPRQRIELFITVCSAIQHAHQKGVVHRDLKPSNILVMADEVSPIPKVIDFGVAKATQGRLTDDTMYTAVEQFIGTPVYMSPEQAEFGGLVVDARSDIYSLGILLYELLTGRPPFDSQTFAKAGVDSIRQQIREVEPPTPSTRVRTLTEADRTTAAKSRGLTPAALPQVLRGDLDWIVMRCLEKDRTRRYATANDLGLDLQHYLRHEPVSARPPSLTYVLGKFLRRHQAGVLAAGAAVAALALGALGRGWWSLHSDRSEPAAPLAHAAMPNGPAMGKSEIVPAESAMNSSPPVASAADPAKVESAQLSERAMAHYVRLNFLREDLAVAEDLARRATELDPDSATAWGVRAGVQAAWLQRNWDYSPKRREDVQTFANRALTLDPNEAEALIALGHLLRSQGADAQAEAVLRRGLTAHPQNVRMMGSLAYLFTLEDKGAHMEEARVLLQNALKLAPDDPILHYDMALSYANYGNGGADPKQLAESIAQLDAATADHPFYSALLLKATLLGGWRGDLRAMRAVLDQGLTFPLSDQTEDRAVWIGMWAGLIEHRPDRVEAAAALTARDFFEDTVMPLRSKGLRLGLAHRVAGKDNLARRDWEEAAAVLRRRLQDQPDDLRSQAELAMTLAWLGRHDEAERIIRTIEPVLKEAHPYWGNGMLALYYGAMGDAKRAAPYLRDSIDQSPFWSRRIIPLDPWWEKLHGQPEFEALLHVPSSVKG